jgi:hypothetical protein
LPEKKIEILGHSMQHDHRKYLFRLGWAGAGRAILLPTSFHPQKLLFFSLQTATSLQPHPVRRRHAQNPHASSPSSTSLARTSGVFLPLLISNLQSYLIICPRNVHGEVMPFALQSINPPFAGQMAKKSRKKLRQRMPSLTNKLIFHVLKTSFLKS